jgi:ATP-dependent RNA helicase DeaD
MTFSSFNLPAQILKAIHEQGYSNPTPIQEKAIPLILSGKDIIGHSETGSGKTAAFGLPMLSKLNPGQGVQALILTPTRELCVQVCDALKGFAKYLPARIVPVFGGVGIGQQISAVRTADIIVATPGRLLDLIQRGLKLSLVRYLVLDEADRMLDMGFVDDVEKILKHTPKHRQTLLFSATLSPRLRSLVHRYMNTPVSVETKTQVDTKLLTEKAFAVSQQEKFSLLVHCLKHETPGIAIVFCKTRRSCDKIAKNLRAQRIDAIPIHGGLSQSNRIHTITTLHKRGLGILVATDVASRGLHISNISHVYNYELPQTSDDYVHRIGRTARAGAKGDAVTFVTPQDVRDFRTIMRDIGREIKAAPLPKFEAVALLAGPAHERSFQEHGGQKKHKQFWKHRR